MRSGVMVASALFIAVGACAQLGPAPNHVSDTSEQSQTDPGLAGVDLNEDGDLAITSDSSMWCEYKCANFPGRWRADAPTDVFAAPGRHPQVISQLAPGEVVNAVRYQRLVKPRRGVVQRAGQGLEAGEVVYMIGGDETSIYLLRHGANFVVEFAETGDNPEIAFEGDYETVDWVFVERSDGRPNGWLRSPMMPGVESPLEE